VMSGETDSATLSEPLVISKFWRDRRRSESIWVTIGEHQGKALVSLRIFKTSPDGIDRRTDSGLALDVRKLPELTKAMLKAERKALELGLLP
jgi:hypothetical protein